MANNNFVVQNGLTVGTTTIFAGNGDIVATGNITSTGSAPASFTSINNTPIGNVTPSTAAFTTVTMSSAGSIVPSANLAVNLGSPTAYFGTIYAGQHTANTVTATSLGGTLTTAGQPNVTTLAGLTSIGTSGVTTTAAGNFTITGCLTVNGTTTTINNTTIETTEYVTTINATNVYAGTIGNSGAVLYGTLNSSSASQPNITTLGGVTSIGASGSTTLTGTLQTASQPNITTLGGVTSIGASGSTTLTGILQTAAQTNITSVGTLTGLTVSGAIVPNSNVTVNLGSTSAWWNTIYGTAIHAQYADLAENYQGDRQYNPGTVLMFGGANEVTVADADTTRVAGVVSTNPAHLMNGALSGPNVVALALTGRVPCMVIGPVAKGDMMVSAGFGYAKVNNAPQCGQVIGKALEDFPILAKGVIEVVVGRF